MGKICEEKEVQILVTTKNASLISSVFKVSVRIDCQFTESRTKQQKELCDNNKLPLLPLNATKEIKITPQTIAELEFEKEFEFISDEAVDPDNDEVFL